MNDNDNMKKNINKAKEAKYCGVCNEQFNKSEYKVLCVGKCRKWSCQKCTGMTNKSIENLATENKNWTCKSCKVPKKKESIVMLNNDDDDSSGPEEEKDNESE
ncbi:hypothetical protein WA026_004252 [Henosepilachna vigintioctopunctata]|uniref:PHD-type domain-containing protein n=1 Tax=Henosepilachna vigintioctopunctata TaxID=420089 RepID=A0AAW1V1L5_9CUCU